MSERRAEQQGFVRSGGLDPDLVEAIVLVESSGCADAFRFEPRFWERYLKDNPAYRDQNPRRVSSSYGLLQIMLPTAREMGFRHEPEMLFVPGVNLDYGTKYLAHLFKRFGGNTELAVRAYNGGPGGADKPVTEGYWKKVQRALKKVQEAR